MSAGLQQLQAFVKDHALTIADLHQGLVKRFGKLAGARRVDSRNRPGVSYRRVYSWVTGARRPDEAGRKMLREACGIDPNAWLTPEEIAREKWMGAVAV